MNVDAPLLAPEKRLLLPSGREGKSKLILFILILWVQRGSGASRCSFTSKVGIAYDMTVQASLVKLHAVEGLIKHKKSASPLLIAQRWFWYAQLSVMITRAIAAPGCCNRWTVLTRRDELIRQSPSSISRSPSRVFATRIKPIVAPVRAGNGSRPRLTPCNPMVLTIRARTSVIKNSPQRFPIYPRPTREDEPHRGVPSSR